jgi:hypothetical protein
MRSGGVATPFLMSALDDREWSASHSGRFTPGLRASGTHWIGDWVSPRVGLDGLDALVRKNLLILPCFSLLSSFFFPFALSVLFLLPVLLCLCLRLLCSVYVTVGSVRTRLSYFIRRSSVICSTTPSRPVPLRANEIRYTYKRAWPLLIATSIIISLSRPLTFRESGKVGPAAHNALHSHYIKILRSMLAVGCIVRMRVRPCERHEVGEEGHFGTGSFLRDMATSC